MAKGNYDNAASFYDKLSRLVFGNNLVKAQVYLLKHIPANAKVLIVGGGTGWILDEISRIHLSGLDITYVEVSANMMALSQKRNIGGNVVHFTNLPIQEVDLADDFDIVITPFLLDNFTDENLPLVFNPIHNALRSGGLWLYTDFQLTGKLWQGIMLKSMLLFFKLLCGVESWRLPDAKGMFARHGYSAEDEKSFFGEFVVSGVYLKK
ncbi:class I SAM-dependent methyltransferase [Mucilaginibacter conchicola]|uniref:Class I SAM-dependent methyltransferase n=1 Tax=Mucilaginibacter conchicola TaxID=2303333 RepID=A0A372NNI7_9SPHI|nr:class I SAM-dependent methyltransferase [Mucilaginibacter conchicola]RFZ90200.1 class I SAM-dependent methyltransferase [Mucilaginibacter conchicola]